MFLSVIFCLGCLVVGVFFVVLIFVCYVCFVFWILFMSLFLAMAFFDGAFFRWWFLFEYLGWEGRNWIW